MNSFLNFLHGEGRSLCANAFRILVLVPAMVTSTIVFAAWLTLRLKGVDFSIDQVKEVLPTIVWAALLVTGGTLVNMMVNEWQKYRESKRTDG